MLYLHLRKTENASVHPVVLKIYLAKNGGQFRPITENRSKYK